MSRRRKWRHRPALHEGSAHAGANVAQASEGLMQGMDVSVPPLTRSEALVAALREYQPKTPRIRATEPRR